MTLPYVFIYPKELRSRFANHIEALLPYMYIIGEIDGDNVHLIKNRLNSKSDVKVKDFQAEFNSMIDFLAE